MNKNEFVEQMRRSLASIDDYVFVNDTIAYYENYIESQIRMGKSEEKVMQELGDPRLIAKSICASHMTQEEVQDNGSYQNFGTQNFERNSQTVLNFNGRQIKLPSWLMKILAVLVAIVIIVLLFTVLKILSPFIMLGVIAYMVYRLVSNLFR